MGAGARGGGAGGGGRPDRRGMLRHPRGLPHGRRVLHHGGGLHTRDLCRAMRRGEGARERERAEAPRKGGRGEREREKEKGRVRGEIPLE